MLVRRPAPLPAASRSRPMAPPRASASRACASTPRSCAAVRARASKSMMGGGEGTRANARGAAAFWPPPPQRSVHHGDADAAVLLAALRRGVRGRRVVLREADDLHPAAVELMGPLEVAGHGGRARGRELPVAGVLALEVRPDGPVIGVALDADDAAGVPGPEDPSDLGHAADALGRELGAAGWEEDVGWEDGDRLAALAPVRGLDDALHGLAELALEALVLCAEAVELGVGGVEVLAERGVLVQERAVGGAAGQQDGGPEEQGQEGLSHGGLEAGLGGGREA